MPRMQDNPLERRQRMSEREALTRVAALADAWEAQGEHDMACSKDIPDEDIAIALLTEGATMVENARHIRNAIEGNEAGSEVSPASLMAIAWDEGEAAGHDNSDSNRGFNIPYKYNPYRPTDD